MSIDAAQQSNLPPLDELSLDRDPFAQFKNWFDLAAATSSLAYPEAMALSTFGLDGYPNSRIVLLKGISSRGFEFFTNQRSDKGAELEANPRAALNFYWDVLHRQVRIVGEVSRLTPAESDEYFATRPRGAQLGAWASAQSSKLESRAVFEAAIKVYDSRFCSEDVPRPAHWGGFRLVPRRFEFWQERSDRLHDRFRYFQQFESPGQWCIERLYP